MEGGVASVTAQRVAAARLTFERVPAPFGDPAADERLCADVAGAAAAGDATPMRRYLAARTRFFDTVVVRALDRGVDQVVVAAAGYDGRSLRYAKPGVRWFEVDRPATQADKLARLARLGIATDHVACCPVDVTVDAVDDALVAAGLDVAKPSLVTLEGLAVYLDRDVLSDLLGRLRRVVADEGSLLAISLSVSTRDPQLAARRAAFARRVAALGEPARTTLTVDDAATLLHEAGWREVPGADERRRRAGLVVAKPVPR